MSPTRLRWILTALLTLSLPAMAEAQPASGGWVPAQIGLRAGYDNSSNATVLGGQLRIPVVPAGWLEVVPSGDVTFLTGLREYQFNADAVLSMGGRSGGVYGGGGLAWRNNLVVGLATRGRVADVPLGIQIEGRWVFLDADFDPRVFTFGVNVPLWGWGGRR